MKHLKKICLVLALVLLSTMFLCACQKEAMVIKETDTYIVVKTTAEAIDGKENMVLLQYMEQLKEKGELGFELKDGMITSINGIDNPADFSSCWMLYTSDTEYANAAWGTVEYQGQSYGSAIVGAEALEIKADQLYIWVYQSFT